MRIGDNILDNPIAAGGIGIGQTIVERAFFGVFNGVFQVAAFFVTKGFAVRDQKLKIASVGTINVGIVKFIDDAVAEGKPHPATCMIGRADAFFGTACPARLDSGRAKSC